MIPRDDIVIAIQAGISMRGAAEYLGVSYGTFKKYADMHNLWDPKSSATGIPRARKSHWTGWTRIGRPEHVRLLTVLKNVGMIEPYCSHCGYDKQRELDMWQPLLISFKNNNEKDMSESNLEVLCYNCYFLDWDRKRHYEHIPLDYVSSLESDTRELDVENIKEPEGLSGDDMLKELEGSLINLFRKN